MTSIELTVGADRLDRVIPNPVELLKKYREDIGYAYLDYKPRSSADMILPEDLAVTLLMNSQVGWRAFQSIQKYGHSIDLANLPKKSLEQTSFEERKQVAALITRLAQYPGIAASVATKILHKKRPALIPILDNQAIFGAYMNPEWPHKPARNDSVRDQNLICKALDWIAYDLNRPENKQAWSFLSVFELRHHKIEIFDSVWWMYFRTIQPIKQRKQGDVV
jgi:hypothetical protein